MEQKLDIYVKPRPSDDGFSLSSTNTNTMTQPLVEKQDAEPGYQDTKSGSSNDVVSVSTQHITPSSKYVISILPQHITPSPLYKSPINTRTQSLEEKEDAEPSLLSESNKHSPLNVNCKEVNISF